MITIFSPGPTARLRYAAHLLFEVVLKVDHQIVSNPEKFTAAEGFKINYSTQELAADLHWQPHSVLTDSTIEPQHPEITYWNELPVFFPQSESLIPFDMLAASFFLASRYEEYLPHDADRHGRFQADQSLAFKHGFLERPLINEWAMALKELIVEKAPGVAFDKTAFCAEATFDIDVAWAYRNKGWWRTTAAFVLDLVNLKFGRFAERWDANFGSRKDPYDTYAYIREQCDQHGVDARYFFLLGDYSSYDRNSSHRNPEVQLLIRQCQEFGRVGIHPSYGSHRSVQQLKKEIKRLADISEKPVHDSRQHYLKMTLPETYRRLIEVGIRRDFTMGYAQQVGFRASLCTPFPFFDLKKNEITELWLYPFAYMDGTLNHYLKLQPHEAKERVSEMVDAVRQVDGMFMCLWHNSSLSNREEWEGWLDVFEHTLSLCHDSTDHGNSE